MASLLQILANYAGLIYLACVVGVALYIRTIFVARQDQRKSLYALEREAATARATRGILMILVLGLLAGATYTLSTYIVPTLATDQPAATPTPAFSLATETPAPTLQPSPTRTPRPTLTPTGAATPIAPTGAAPALTPTPLPLPPASCPDPNVQLVAPAPGQTFNGSIQLRGTADTPNFAFYKFTLKGPATGEVAQTVGDVVRVARRNAVLGDIDGAALLAQPGAYLISLIVVDNTGNEFPACSVPVIIQP